MHKKLNHSIRIAQNMGPQMQPKKRKSKPKHPHKALIPKARLGRVGENLCCWYLKNRGWEILARNYRSKGGEVDIIAMTKNELQPSRPKLIFLEVKTRQSPHGLGPECSVSERKRRRILNCLRHWLLEHQYPRAELRCDISAITKAHNTAARIRYYENAFTEKTEFGW